VLIESKILILKGKNCSRERTVKKNYNYLGSNMTGTNKIKLLLTGHSTKPRYLMVLKFIH